MKFSGKTWLLILQIAIFVIAWYYVIDKTNVYINSINWHSIHFNPTRLISGFILIIILMIINWSIEAYKWKFSLKKIVSINFRIALFSVLAGTTAAIISPNRSGEPIGRAYFLKQEDKANGLGAAIICSISQFTVTVITGLLVFPLFSMYFPQYLSPSNTYLLSAILVIITLVIYFKSNYVLKKISSLKIINKLPFIKNIDGNSFNSNLWILLLLSFSRYIVFFVQFYFMLKIWGIKIEIQEAFVAIAMTYFITTIIPTTTLVELGIRCSSSIYFIGHFDNQPLIITIASMSLWLINISIPGLLGSLFYVPGFKNYIGNRT